MTVAAASSSSSSSSPTAVSDDEAFLNTTPGEITFFRSIMRARPVGIHRFFHVLAIRNAIYKDTSRWVAPEAIWNKLRSCYNLDALEAADYEHENLYTPHKNSLPIPIPSPDPEENLANHPFFRAEFQLPYDDDVENLILERRMRGTASTPSTPGAAPVSTPPPPPTSSSTASKRQKGSKKRGKSQSKLAGLIGGDSDSSALTQESGDETMPETPRESVVTGTDAGTDYGDEEDTEMREPSPRSVSPKPTRGRGGSKSSKRGRGAGARGAASTRSAKKRKR
ncbi:hypothetical protein D9611_008799 [Ephemerocybe angulata]|uniref:CT20-domain-containing protein n=1 Tax=Ephemerocybe angulata TaxID=980116 RepID=A0A8H5CBV9_9AGAR|nr:hypothetical protein D9611_008799 [Tulosesus angulatus]